MKSIAKLLVAARDKLDITQQAMAEKLGVSQSTISLVERTGEIALSRDLPRYAAAYKVCVEDITPRTRVR